MSESTQAEQATIQQAVTRWLEKVVIGLNLCPFAAGPHKRHQIHIALSKACDVEALLEEVKDELQHLENMSAKERETTLLVFPELLSDFYDYNDFLDLAEGLLAQCGWSGQFQLASFHPDYQFGGTAPDDAENLTNRAPYAMLHLIREESMEKAVSSYPNPENIPDTNIERVEGLSEAERQELFPYLYAQGAKCQRPS